MASAISAISNRISSFILYSFDFGISRAAIDPYPAEQVPSKTDRTRANADPTISRTIRRSIALMVFDHLGHEAEDNGGASVRSVLVLRKNTLRRVHSTFGLDEFLAEFSCHAY